MGLEGSGWGWDGQPMGIGWAAMGADERRWAWMDINRCGWASMDVDGCGWAPMRMDGVDGGG